MFEADNILLRTKCNFEPLCAKIYRLIRRHILEDLIVDPLIQFDNFETYFYKFDAYLETWILFESQSLVSMKNLLDILSTWRFTVYYNLIFGACVGWIPFEVASEIVDKCLQPASAKSSNDFVQKFKVYMQAKFNLSNKVTDLFNTWFDVVNREALLIFKQYVFNFPNKTVQ